ncbi:MAG: NUDIX hydrolase [Candidatus Saccharimonadales bacterium]
MQPQDGAFVVLFKDETHKEVFLVFRSDKPIWNLPGGGIEPSESPEQAAVREVMEETGFTIKLSLYVGTYRNINVKTGGLWNKAHLYTGAVTGGTFIPEFPGCKGQWFAVDDLPEAMQPVTRVRIADALHPPVTPFEKDFVPAQ